jgi:hypothetical protein
MSAGRIARHGRLDEGEQRLELVFTPAIQERFVGEIRPVGFQPLVAPDAVLLVGDVPALGLLGRVDAVEHGRRRLREGGRQAGRQHDDRHGQVSAHGLRLPPHRRG